jgi:hypothetical protein
MNELIAIEKIAQWEKLKALVLDSVSSPVTKCVHNMALNEFMEWFQEAPRLHQVDRKRLARIALRSRPRVVVHHY